MLDFGIQPGFFIQIYRDVQQGTGRCQPELFTPFGQGNEAFQRRIEIGAPDVAPIHQAHGQDLVVGQPGGYLVHLFRRPHGIDVQAVHGQLAGQREIVLQSTEISSQKALELAALEPVVTGFESAAIRRWQVQHQNRLVDLHPCYTHVLQAPENFPIGRQQLVQQVQFVEIGPAGLAQPEVGQGSQDHRFYLEAQLVCLAHLFEKSFGTEHKLLIPSEFRHDVMIIGIEPFGHFTGLGRLASGGPPTGHAEIQVAFHTTALPAEAGRHHAQQGAHVQHLVVPGKVTHGNPVDAGIPLQAPVAFAQAAAVAFQRAGINLTAPIGFQGVLEFALGADAGKTEVVSCDHVRIPCLRVVALKYRSGIFFNQSQFFEQNIEFASSCL